MFKMKDLNQENCLISLGKMFPQLFVLSGLNFISSGFRCIFYEDHPRQSTIQVIQSTFLGVISIQISVVLQCQSYVNNTLHSHAFSKYIRWPLEPPNPRALMGSLKL